MSRTEEGGEGGNPQRGLLIVLSGPAGSGKGTTVKKILENPRFGYSVSATTRQPRPGEREGVDYFFKSREEFLEEIRDDRLLEYAEYCGNYYGTPREAVEERLRQGIHVILEIEVQGALQVKKREPSALLLMLLPPDFQTLEGRLRGRATESEEAIRLRLAAVRGELAKLPLYDYLLINREGQAEETARQIQEIVWAEQRRIKRLPGGTEQFIRAFYGEALPAAPEEPAAAAK